MIFFPVLSALGSVSVSRFPRSYYTQHFVDTFRQGVIDLLLGNLDDISEICTDDPIEQIANIAQSALVPQSRAPKYFNYGVMGSELRLVEDTIVCARCIVYLFFVNILEKLRNFTEKLVQTQV